MKREREEEQVNGLAEESPGKKTKLDIEENSLGLDMDELPVTAVFNANTVKGQVKKGRECPYLDTISRQVTGQCARPARCTEIPSGSKLSCAFLNTFVPCRTWILILKSAALYL